ncbi:MAG TPA: hypothetical protein VMU94_07950 [Streptosporangiaceae bacterium]|nr:hypothetical protein [Streptosporangiaceae bacterium]
MARIIMFIVAAAAIFVILWMLFWSVVHFLVVGFWIVLIAVIGIGLLRMGRRSRARQ